MKYLATRIPELYIYNITVLKCSSITILLTEIQLRIEGWFETELEKVKYQSRVNDIQEPEKVRIFHHELHQNHIKRSSILKLKTEDGIIEGHRACLNHLQEVISDLLEHPAVDMA